MGNAMCARTGVLGTPGTLPRDSEGSNAPGREYIGSYGKLVHFLQECQQKSVIDEDRYLDLLSAVEDINRHGQGEEVDGTHSFFTGTEDVFDKFLPAYGIQTTTVCRSASAKDIDSRPSAASDNTNHEDVLSDPFFNCLSRGDVQADTRLIIYAMSSPHNLVERYQLDTAVLGSWLDAIGRQYIANPYHSWNHAVDVFQFAYSMLTAGEASDHLSVQDILSVMLATVSHDVGHPGTNNAFLVNSHSRLAITYNDKSVLENMHSSICFETMARPGLNLLESFSDNDAKAVREKVIDAILATDMAHHFALVDRFTARVSKDPDNPLALDCHKQRETLTRAPSREASKEDRRMLIQMLVHMADLGNCARPWNTHKHLVVALEEEFFAQGDQERKLGIPIMPMMDRTKDSAATSQGFFLEKLVGPLLDPVCRFLTADLGRRLQDNLTDNKIHWASLVERFGGKTAADLIPLEENGHGEAHKVEEEPFSRVVPAT